MALATVRETMLYCPKCKRSYEEGSQRFCSTEGARLVSSSIKPNSGKQGVFTSILGRAAASEITIARPAFDGSTAPRETIGTVHEPFSEPEEIMFSPPDIEDTVDADILDLDFNEPSAEPAVPEKIGKFVTAKPVARLIKPSEIPSSQASLGDRAVSPAGREALTWENPRVLLGETVKGRYVIEEILGEDDVSIAYIAKDKLGTGKRVVVRVLMDEDPNDADDRAFAEERVSLSHLIHPNIISVIDSSTLLEGIPFIITEFVDGTSLKEKLRHGQFNALRAARIIRQASYALSEVHQNGIVHRSLKPSNILLTVSDSGAELVKVANFGVSRGVETSDNLAYLSPEQVEGKPAGYASDIYSLAVIAYEMLTGRVPFNGANRSELQKQMRGAPPTRPSDLRLDLPPIADSIIEKALSAQPVRRYPKARDFGDALYNALSTESPWQEKAGDEAVVAEVLPAGEIAVSEPEPGPELSHSPDKELAWEKRSPEPVKEASSSWMLLSILGVLLAFVGLWAIWHYWLNRANPNEYVAPPVVAEQPAPQNTNAGVAVQPTPASADIEIAPLPRAIPQPENTEFFQNSKTNLDGDLARNFRGFKFFYPNDWTVSPLQKEDPEKKVPRNFVDVSKKIGGVPVEQMLVSYYSDSKGTFKGDLERFPKIVQDANRYFTDTLKVPDYRFVSEGETTLNESGWRAYEMKFTGSLKSPQTGEKVPFFGRRLYIPAMGQGIKSGLVITMLATSLSGQVKSVDEVGTTGGLKTVLDTFEPGPNY
jgi:serine/threonine protein kinase